MADVLTLKVKSVAYKDITATATEGEGTLLNGIQEGLSITQDDGTEVEIPSEISDAPLYLSKTAGKINITFDLASFDPTTIQLLTGGTSVSGVYEYPSTQPNIEKKWKIAFTNGMKDLVIQRASVTTKLNGTDMKTNALKISVTLTALVGSLGYVSANYGETERTTW